MTEPTKEAIPDEGLERALKWPDPTPEMLDDPRFNAIWTAIKTWDINVPEAYSGYCGATGNHVRAILDALIPALDAFAAQRVAEAEAQNKALWAVAEWADCYMNSTTEHDENQAVMQLREAIRALKEPR